MKKLIIKPGLECVLSNDGKWTCLDKDVRSFYERFLNYVSDTVLGSLSPSDGDPMSAILRKAAEYTRAIEVIDTDKAPTTTTAGTVN